jgi:hypothetical protein
MAGNKTLSGRNRVPADKFHTQPTDICAQRRNYREHELALRSCNVSYAPLNSGARHFSLDSAQQLADYCI